MNFHVTLYIKVSLYHKIPKLSRVLPTIASKLHSNCMIVSSLAYVILERLLYFTQSVILISFLLNLQNSDRIPEYSFHFIKVFLYKDTVSVAFTRSGGFSNPPLPLFFLVAINNQPSPDLGLSGYS